MGVSRTWLDVSYREKDEAKAAGARWDATARRWYAPPGRETSLERWLAGPAVPELLPGEDRTLGQGLFVDLVPSSCWFTNVRFCVSPRDWERLRRMITGRAGQRCEVCGAAQDRDVSRWLEAHERWVYDEDRLVQRLARLICLCTDCHRVTHFGLAQLRGQAPEALRHLMNVTGMTEEQAHAHVAEAFKVWRARSEGSYELDLSILTDVGISLAPPPAANSRQSIAADALRRGSIPPQQSGRV